MSTSRPRPPGGSEGLVELDWVWGGEASGLGLSVHQGRAGAGCGSRPGRAGLAEAEGARLSAKLWACPRLSGAQPASGPALSPPPAGKSGKGVLS